MKNSIENPRNAAVSPEDIIKIIRQEVNMMGANDYEIPELNRLLEQLRNGEIAPEEAIAQARAIKAAKQDYH